MQRRTVLLRHWLGLSVDQTAAELGIASGTVKSNTARGIEKLKALLTDHEPPRQALSPERSA